MTKSTKYTLYSDFKKLLEERGFKINPFREIEYGLQFIVFRNDVSGIIRIFESKKGLKLDFSQVKNDDIKESLKTISNILTSKPGKTLSFDKAKKEKEEAQYQDGPEKDPENLIGIDESGKGDYFGPLVVAAVQTTEATIPLLKKMGVADSKTLTDTRILELEPQIKALCEHNVLTMGNHSYNTIYKNMQNLNHILAWAHARVIENMLEKVDCRHALSDQFGNKSLIQTHLFGRGKQITLYQRHHAESNIAVAAASILARASYLDRLDRLKKEYGMEFPKGCSKKTKIAAHYFVSQIGEKNLENVAKLHFKLTQELLDQV